MIQPYYVDVSNDSKPWQFKEGNTARQIYDEPMTERINIKLTPALMEKLEKMAEYSELSRAEVLRKYIEEFTFDKYN